MSKPLSIAQRTYRCVKYPKLLSALEGLLLCGLKVFSFPLLRKLLRCKAFHIAVIGHSNFRFKQLPIEVVRTKDESTEDRVQYATNQTCGVTNYEWQDLTSCSNRNGALESFGRSDPANDGRYATEYRGYHDSNFVLTLPKYCTILEERALGQCNP